MDQVSGDRASGRNGVTFPIKANKRFRGLSTVKVTVLVLAAAAPLAAMIGNMPVAFGMGSGLLMPAAFVAVSACLFCFAAGFTAMSRDIVSTGAFYTYIAKGLGKTVGIAGAYVAVFSYAAYTVGLIAALGYFVSASMGEAGIGIHWLAGAAIAALLVGVLGYRSLDMSARTLAAFMIAECGILAVFDIAILLARGAGALPLQVLAPPGLGSGRFGLAILYAVVCFVGFESAALYGEETRDPRRAVPRATFLSLGVIGGFYLFTVWCMIGAVGADRLVAVANAASGTLMLDLAAQYVGAWFAALTGILLLTSLLASLLALHNVTSRYMFALARDGLLPRSLAQFHPRHHSPHIASLTTSAIGVAAVGLLGIAGVAPYVGIASVSIGIGTVGIILLQAMTACAAFAWLRRNGGARWIAALTGLGAAGLIAALAVVVNGFPLLAGGLGGLVAWLPASLLLVIAAGLVQARRLRRAHPGIYASIAETDLRTDTRRRAPAAIYQRRYCIVGGGPSGLIMARALKHENVPFDCFEKHSDTGGIWDPENAGSPMYESAHFISSKWSSYFMGFPMPDDYPDYPDNRQILAYIRAFTDEFDLRRHITFGTSVSQAIQQPDHTWQVSLSNGEQRRYDGLICASGVTWHPTMPTLPGDEIFQGEIRHSVTYRSAAEFRGRRVLVVGAGNSGVDIACDAARGAARAFISLRRGYRFVPKHLFGIPTDVFIKEQLSPPKGVALPSNLNALLDALAGDLTRLGLKKPDHDALASHPIMNTQILHHLAHGDITAKPDIARLDAHGVVFADGSREDIDLILLATGYEYQLPYLDPKLFEWKGGRPQLYLNIMHRTIDSLYVMGFIEFADAAYRRFDEMAQVIVADIHARETGINRELLLSLRRDDDTDLRGGKHYLDSPRHANYVDAATYARVLMALRHRLGWPDPTDESYDAIRVRRQPPLRAAA
jgi:cation diffusion facilitator CzcD-associated flavoprotein CzcO/amino acid transporter